MKNKILITFIMVSIVILSLSGCNQNAKEEPVNLKPQTSNMKTIAELAVMDVYYHNVAKFKEEGPKWKLFGKKDKHFWIEYSGIVKIGIDVSLLSIVVNENVVEITIPNAKVLEYEVDQDKLTNASYLYAEDSVEGSAEDETKAFQEAQIEMVRVASTDTTLLASAQQRAQKLLEEYVNTIGETTGKKYSIQWSYIEDESSLLDDIETEDNESDDID